MSALPDFIKATASYYGIPLDQLTDGSALDATRGDIEVVLRVALTVEDVMAVAGRMVALRATADEAATRAAEQQAVADKLDLEELRRQYKELSISERSGYGSFARYLASQGLDPYPSAEVRHG